MSKFVNFNKRSVTLPAGCKELMDILEPAKRRKRMELSAPGAKLKVIRDDFFICKPYEIGKPIREALESKAPTTMLSVASPDNQVCLQVQRMEGQPLSTSVVFTHSPDSEHRMKAIFHRLGLRVPPDSETPATFMKDQPVLSLFEISSERVLPDDLAALATIIFQDFCGTGSTSQMQVHFFEVTHGA